MRALVLAGLVAVSACARAAPVVAPAADLTACVLVHAFQGESLPQIAIDCGSDIPAVIDALIHATSSKPDVVHTQAYGEALARLEAARGAR